MYRRSGRFSVFLWYDGLPRTPESGPPRNLALALATQCYAFETTAHSFLGKFGREELRAEGLQAAVTGSRTPPHWISRTRWWGIGGKGGDDHEGGWSGFV